jgi:hypothetical protein
MPVTTFRKRRGKRDPLEELAEQIGDEGPLGESGLGEEPGRTGTRLIGASGSDWRVVEGPTGRGECLIEGLTDLEFRFLAPPGVPLQLPELSGSLKRWRTALWTCGAVAGHVKALELAEAYALAPDQSAWIDAYSEDREDDPALAGLEAQGPAFDGREASSVSFLPDRRRLLSVTKSASTFAMLVSGLPPDSAFARIEGVANATASRDQFDAVLGMVSESLGEDMAHELVLALLHARARSHSWRYTRFLSWTQRRAPRHRVVGREVDRARTDRELTEGLATVELPRRELDQVLVDTLYERSRCLRWRVTGPLRWAFGTSSLRGPRGVMRNRVQPGYERLRAGRQASVSRS